MNSQAGTPPSAVRIFVPRDSSALALGADALAAAIEAEAARRGVAIELVRNGSRGLLGLEPLVEVQTPAGRVGYGNVEAADVAALVDAGWLDGGGSTDARAVGLVEEIPYLKRQQRLTFARLGLTDPLSIDDYLAHEGLVGLKAALAIELCLSEAPTTVRAGVALAAAHLAEFGATNDA